MRCSTECGQVDAGIAAVAGQWGTVDVLVPNAGIQIVNPVQHFAYADWKRRLAIHLDGAFLTSKAALLAMTIESQITPAALPRSAPR